MKITCQSCQAKYTIADEKVLGKIVKIRCKKCSATIVVNGSDPSAAPAYDTASQGAGADEGWTVNVADGDQRTMNDAEVAAAFQAGVIGVETFCWRDGMSDWLPLREIEALFEACNAARMVASAPPREAKRASGRVAAPATEYAAAPGNGSANGGAARRQGGRAPGADLFHGAAQAGGEEEVMTSAPAGAPQAFDEQKPTGARNENSVLFSLSALTSKGTDRPPPVPGVEASGLIDIRQLSAQMGRGDDKKRSRVDDIMNLTSGGAFNGALSAPTLTAPSIDQYGPPAGEAAGSGKSKGLIFMALGAGAFVIVGAVGVTMLLMRGKGADADSAAASSAAGLTAAPSASVAMAAASAAAAAASASAPEATAAATDTTAAASASAAAPAATAAATTTTAAPAAAAPAAPATPHVQTPSAPAAPAHTAAAPAAVPAALAAAAQADQPFNMGEAKSKLAAAAATAQTCKKGDVTGTGHAVIVFAPNGGVQTVTITGPPFEGTPTANCVSGHFRGVHVPAFSGSPFSVSKSFTIN
jgi:predicted Zn finger-like uncharacterized protein